MRRVISALILGIFLIGLIGIVSAEENNTCNSNDDCELKDKPYCCGNETRYYKSCYNINETPQEVNCTPPFGCPGIEQINTCRCVNNVCKGSFVSNETEDEEDNETEDDDGVSINKTRISKENLTFTPWQKRNESECLEGCFCRGAVMTCTVDGVKTMTIQAGRSGNIIVITFDGTEVETELELETDTDGENDTELNAKMSNGEKKQIKIMPDTAAERALERLRLKNCNEENNCTIELKEVGNKPVYELQVERHMKLLALFTAKAQVKAQVDAGTGEIIVVKKPWWAFLATEPEE